MAQLIHDLHDLQAALCAYNAGEGAVRQALRAGHDPNLCTTGHDYGRDVLERYAVVKTL